MSDEPEQTGDKPRRGRPPKADAALVRGVIMVDGVWSSHGEHRKGEKVSLSAEDAAILEGREMFTRFE
jgi:hypothetical protein